MAMPIRSALTPVPVELRSYGSASLCFAGSEVWPHFLCLLPPRLPRGRLLPFFAPFWAAALAELFTWGATSCESTFGPTEEGTSTEDAAEDG